MKQILVPTDLSVNTDVFFSYAFNFASVIDAGITIVHSFHPQPASLDGMLLVNADLQGLQEESFDQYVEDIIEKYKDHEVSVEKKFLVGFAADTILEYADESRAYMIMMNTSGGGTLKKIFGSVSTEVMKHADVPVLLVPFGYQFNMIKQILYADDFTDNHDTGLVYLDHLVGDFLPDLICAHVVEDSEPPDHTDWLDLSNLNQKFAGVKISQVAVSCPSIMSGLIKLAEENNADLIVMPSRKKGFVYNLFHHSVTRELTMTSTKPILVIH